MMLSPLVWWGLWCLATLKHGGTASAAILPKMERLFQDFRKIFEEGWKQLGTQTFENSADINKLPANYHNEEKQQRKLGNGTVYSQYEINKVTNNHTGDMMFSEKMFTSVEQVPVDANLGKEKREEASPEEKSFETYRPTSERGSFKEGVPQPKPRLTFFIFRLPQNLMNKKQDPEASWLKEEPVNDRRHRLQAIRKALLTAPHPIKKKVLLVTPNHNPIPRKRRFFFFLWKI